MRAETCRGENEATKKKVAKQILEVEKQIRSTKKTLNHTSNVVKH